MKRGKKSLKFATEFVDLVLEGKKNTTWRLFDDKNLKKGDKIDLINKHDGKIFGKAVIEEVHEKKLAELTTQDKEGQADFGTLPMICAHMSKLYNRDVTANTLVKVIKFKLAKK